MGSPAFAVPALEAVAKRHEVALVVTQPDKPVGRGKRVTSPAVKIAAEALGIPVAQPRATRKPAFAETLREVEAEVGVVVAYGRILPRAVLDAFPHGCLNIHASLLPKYRGAAPIQWAIIRGEEETGVAIMRLDEGMDTGPVIAERRLPIAADDTAGDLAERLAPVGAELLVEVLAQVETGTAHERPQDHAVATYAPMLTKADGAIDWSQDARAVSARIRGVDPWPGAQTTLEGDPLKLFAPAVVSEDGGEGAPGQILSLEGGLVVACGQGALRVAEVQAPGKRRMPADAFARGRKLSPGALLGG
jgi:methionyl-tRNA formyltransferase